MAVFIKRDRLGSRPPLREVSRSQVLSRERQGTQQKGQTLTQIISSMPSFKALEQSMAQAKEKQAESLKGKWDDNAEVQNWRTKTEEEKGRDAIDRMMPTAREVVEMRKGGEATHEEVKKYVETLAYKSDRQKKGE